MTLHIGFISNKKGKQKRADLVFKAIFFFFTPTIHLFLLCLSRILSCHVITTKRCSATAVVSLLVYIIQLTESATLKYFQWRIFFPKHFCFQYSRTHASISITIRYIYQKLCTFTNDFPAVSSFRTMSSNPSSADPSTSTFVSSMVFNIVISTVLMLSFGIARKVSMRIYAPRTYLVPER